MRFPTYSAWALAALLFGSVLAFGATQRWPESLLQAGAFGLGIAWSIFLAFTRRAPRFSVLVIPLSLVALWGWLQMFYGTTVYTLPTRSAALGWTGDLALLVVSMQIFAFPGLRERFLRGLLYLGLLVCVIGLAQYLTSPRMLYWMVPTPAGASFSPFVNLDHLRRVRRADFAAGDDGGLARFAPGVGAHGRSGPADRLGDCGRLPRRVLAGDVGICGRPVAGFARQ